MPQICQNLGGVVETMTLLGLQPLLGSQAGTLVCRKVRKPQTGERQVEEVQSAATGGAGRGGQDIHIQQHRYSSCSEQKRRGTHGKEMMSYLDEVWKMARL